MNFSRSKVLLKKINAIHDSGEAFEGKLSALERDLMLQYLREFYECVAANDQSPQVVHQRSNTREEAVLHVPLQAQSPVAPPVQKVQAVPPPAPQVQSPDPKLAVQTNRQENIPQAASPQSSSPQAKPQTVTHTLTQETVAPVVEVPIGAEFEELFSEPQTTDRSQRFANGPISDIGKAMGINERILTINDLFKGDQQAFTQAISKLNGFSSFEEAKNFLASGIMKSNDWTSNKRMKKAKVFVRLVRRKYQS